VYFTGRLLYSCSHTSNKQATTRTVFLCFVTGALFRHALAPKFMCWVLLVVVASQEHRCGSPANNALSHRDSSPQRAFPRLNRPKKQCKKLPRTSQEGLGKPHPPGFHARLRHRTAKVHILVTYRYTSVPQYRPKKGPKRVQPQAKLPRD